MLEPGDNFAGYQILELIGAGGMGEVYRARDRDGLPRDVALKVLHSTVSHDADIRKRFQREADIVAALDHPNLVTIFARGDYQGHLWFSMRYVPGTDLARVLKRETRLAPERAVRILAETAAALDCAHTANVLHRDVKPANILLTRAPQERALLTDFGIAKDTGSESVATATAHLLATFQYLAPERITAPRTVDHRADVYALGCTLYYMLTGELPYPHRDVPLLLNGHINGPIPLASNKNRDLSARFDTVITKALAKDPLQRFSSCGDLAEAAREAMTRTPRPTANPGEAGPAGRPTPQAVVADPPPRSRNANHARSGSSVPAAKKPARPATARGPAKAAQTDPPQSASGSNGDAAMGCAVLLAIPAMLGGGIWSVVTGHWAWLGWIGIVISLLIAGFLAFLAIFD
ncbi:serine/threonine-protein kinase [Nocardia heshunensis]